MEPNNIQAAINAGKELGNPADRIIYIGGLPVLIAPSGMVAHLLKNVTDAEDARAEQPRARRGSAVFSELASFISHANRFKDADSAVFADVEAVRLTAVYDYNKAGTVADQGQRWGRHRAVYVCPQSEAWQRWNAHSGKEMSQDAFAQFIEDHMEDLASPVGNGDDKDLPSPSEVLTMARNLVVNTKGAFQRVVDPVTGNFTMINKTENDAGTTKIPRAFKLQLQVFEAGAYYGLQARIRFQLLSGVPRFSYLLYRAAETLRDAFGEVRTQVVQQTALPLFAGAPEE